MRSRIVLVGALAGSILTSCKAGQAGPVGPAGLSVGDGGTATTCQAGSRFCEGTGVWECSRVGLDAVLVQDCAQAGSYYPSANNPWECSTTHCGPYDYGACCNTKKPTCVWSITAPIAASGSAYSNRSVAPYCYTSTVPVCAGTGSFYFDWYDTDYTICQPAAREIYMYVPRTPGAFPRTINLASPPAGFGLNYYAYANGNFVGSCSTWTGTVTWTSDDPTWSVTISATAAATCTTTPGVVISGTFNGDV